MKKLRFYFILLLYFIFIIAARYSSYYFISKKYFNIFSFQFFKIKQEFLLELLFLVFNIHYPI